MKMTDLEPRWWSDTGGKEIKGISFLCPHCKAVRLSVRVDHTAAHTIPVKELISNSVPPTFVVHNVQVWQISGDSPSFDGYAHGGFEHVSLSPSVDASKHGHWHGFVTNGEVR